MKPKLAMGFILALYLLAAWGCSPSLEQFGISTQGTQFEKLDHEGNPLSAKRQSWSCVKDTSTGLIWEAKKDNERLHHNTATYTQTGPGQGSCNSTETGRCTTADFIAAVNQTALCGYSDWRLPSATELSSLMEAQPKPNPQVCDCFFPHTQRGPYWSSSVGTNTTENQFKAIHFSSGATLQAKGSSSFYVRLVRGNQQESEDR